MRPRIARSVSISLHQSHITSSPDQDVITTTEYELNWRSVIFVPFGEFWQFVLNASVVFNSFWVIFYLAYKTTSNETSTDWLHYSMEILYLLDTLLLIAHR